MKPDQRMRLDSLPIVNRYAEARTRLLSQIRMVETPYEGLTQGGPKYRILIDGELLGDDILALVRPVILNELRAQVKALDRDLTALGVDPGSQAA